MISSLSNWIELVSIATFEAKRRNPSGSCGEYQMVRFGSGGGPKVVERLQEAEAGLGHQRPAVVAHAADRFRHPGRVAGEQIVIFGRPQESDDAELDDEIVDDLLRLLLGQRAVGRGRARNRCRGRSRRGPATWPRHSAPSRWRDSRNKAIAPLLARLPDGNVEAIFGRHPSARRAPDLLAQLLAVADDLIVDHSWSSAAFSCCLRSISRSTP